jgi:hypothetical protein
MLHGGHGVEDLVHIVGPPRRQDACFGGEHVLQGTLRALDLAREHRLLADVHRDEQFRMRQGADRPVQPTECAISVRAQRQQRMVEADGRLGWERCRQERPVAGELANPRSAARRFRDLCDGYVHASDSPVYGFSHTA